MSKPVQIPITRESQATWDALRSAVAKALERKRKLGQYAVIWSDGAPVAIGDDAPEELKRKAAVK